jgi:ethanolamine utilization protein EutN
MRIAKVIGDVTLNRWHPGLKAGSYRLVVPMTLAELAGDTEPAGEELIAYDELGAGVGTLIALSEGGEAAQPFYPNDKPIDAYNAAILDNVRILET